MTTENCPGENRKPKKTETYSPAKGPPQVHYVEGPVVLNCGTAASPPTVPPLPYHLQVSSPECGLASGQVVQVEWGGGVDSC